MIMMDLEEAVREKHIFKDNWQRLFSRLLYSGISREDDNSKIIEAIGFNYKMHPIEDYIMSNNAAVFNPKKAIALHEWYKKADATDKSILDYFDEYKRCIDNIHDRFNSNYGLYAYKERGLQRCIYALKNNKASRQACFCINNNYAMSPLSIDKLCTNAIMFFIHKTSLRMIVQMRSSNMITLLPYDFFIFSVWYLYVYKQLLQTYPMLCINEIDMHVGSFHITLDDLVNKLDAEFINNANELKPIYQLLNKLW